MALQTIPNDVFVSGQFRAGSMSIPNASVGNAAVISGAAIDTEKLMHQRRSHYTQPNTTATSVTQIIHICEKAGTLKAFSAASIVACIGAATITVDLRKNGVTMLGSVITLDNGNTAYVIEAGSLSVTTLAAGDVLTVVVVATAGGGTIGTGLGCAVTVDEAPVT